MKLNRIYKIYEPFRLYHSLTCAFYDFIFCSLRMRERMNKLKWWNQHTQKTAGDDLCHRIHNFLDFELFLSDFFYSFQFCCCCLSVMNNVNPYGPFVINLHLSRIICNLICSWLSANRNLLWWKHWNKEIFYISSTEC